MNRRTTVRALVAAAALLGFAAQAQAQAPEIRLAKQFSMGYLQLNVMDHQKLIEKHAKLLGIPEVKVTWQTFNGPSAMNDALIVRQHRHRVRRRAGPDGGVVEDQGHPAGDSRNFRVDVLSRSCSTPAKPTSRPSPTTRKATKSPSPR